jgi:hypothetical protein
MGLAAANIAQGDEGLVVAFGKVRQVNTAAFAEGDILYADPSTPGGLTATAPTAPNWKTIVALVITDSATVGELFVRVSFGSQLGNDESVTLTSPTAGEVLTYNGTVWANAAPAASGIPATLLDAKGDLIVASAADTAARLAVGTDGQVLTAASTASNGVTWSVNPISFFNWTGYVSGSFYVPMFVYGNGSTVANWGAGQIMWAPFFCVRTQTFDRIQVYTNQVTNGQIRMAIYDSTGTAGAPGSLVLDCGTASTAGAAGDKNITISQQLTRGLYWLAVNGNAAHTLSAYTNSTNRISPSQGGGAHTFGYYSLQTYGAYPSTAPAVVEYTRHAGISLRAA